MHDSIRHPHAAAQISSPHMAIGLCALLVLSVSVFAQTPARSGVSHPPAPLHAQAAPPAPPKPDWPINDQPKPAAITWQKDELRIDATNASLQQIMNDVASATGASVNGLTKDERIFGAYGPAPARDVLAQLLQGSGYNIVMVGDQGQGAPREIILSARTAGSAPQNASHPAPEEEEDIAPEPQYEPPPQQQQPPQQVPPQAMRPGFIPGAPGTVQYQQQQQQMQGQQQQPIQQGQPQQNQPPNNQ